MYCFHLKKIDLQGDFVAGVNCFPSNLLSGSTLPPSLCHRKYSIFQTVCGWEGGGGYLVLLVPYSVGVSQSVSDQIQNLQNC